MEQVVSTLEAVLSTGSTGSWHGLQASYLEQGPTDGWGKEGMQTPVSRVVFLHLFLLGLV